MEIGPIIKAMIRNKTSVFLLVVEIGVTLAIVMNCLGIIIDQQRIMNRYTGIDEPHIIGVTMRPFADAFQDRDYRIQVIRDDLDMLRNLPGVVDASAISPFPLIDGGSSTNIKPNGASDDRNVLSPVYSADPHVLQTLGLELLEGRIFTEADIPVQTGPQPMNVLITKDLADALFPDGNALGQQIDSGSPDFPDTVVGIVKHMQTPYNNGSPMETRITFFPGYPGSASRIGYLVRTEPGRFDAVYGSLERALFNKNSERLLQLQPLSEIKGNAYAMNTFLSRVLGALIGLLAFVTGIGILGMTSFAVTRRTKQIGVRRALGASRFAILRYFLVENSIVALMGILLGLAGGYGLNVLLVTRAGIKPIDALVVLGCMFFIWAVGLLATIAPAIRAAAVPPAVASRTV